ncbi:hypothetical protein XIS1_60008 [Xenorhabdus innexi]|uniref:Uncharacterized protein n=1 Tax=Xenorhabdus innexi TaxID=290109 RepID=A0A1N6MZD0_9GAMM|nr:hypothetical protein XIS1_60008 [Xenorhabdus innexi]
MIRLRPIWVSIQSDLALFSTEIAKSLTRTTVLKRLRRYENEN